LTKEENIVENRIRVGGKSELEIEEESHDK